MIYLDLRMCILFFSIIWVLHQSPAWLMNNIFHYNIVLWGVMDLSGLMGALVSLYG